LPPTVAFALYELTTVMIDAAKTVIKQNAVPVDLLAASFGGTMLVACSLWCCFLALTRKTKERHYSEPLALPLPSHPGAKPARRTYSRIQSGGIG